MARDYSSVTLTLPVFHTYQQLHQRVASGSDNSQHCVAEGQIAKVDGISEAIDFVDREQNDEVGSNVDAPNENLAKRCIQPGNPIVEHCSTTAATASTAQGKRRILVILHV